MYQYFLYSMTVSKIYHTLLFMSLFTRFLMFILLPVTLFAICHLNMCYSKLYISIHELFEFSINNIVFQFARCNVFSQQSH